ncbi:hypothetical protein [Anaeromyxobacter sp. Fw109-5]|uniref:hypothetical protein n=1 Tax=Anaeromyxobacter sp. (strain Fw109-5) TaxID=404589 RepID=UPI0000ED8B39|nr:hypothetical protein [Anaeromyxobacter sp. Fw109-5]ABS27469.1 hypothetical protein Anae109_3280 [Anaeromyxobacter sp. Fw109-5]
MRYTIDSSEMELSWSHGEAGAGARVREFWASGVHPQFRSAAHVLELDGVALVRGRHDAIRDLVVRGEDEAPQVVYHLGLRGHPTAQVEGTDGFLSHRPHASDLAFSPSTRTIFIVDRNASNEAFEVNFTLQALERWAGRYPDLLGPLEERVGRGVPFRDHRVTATPTHEVIALVESTMDSSRYGSLRACFVEARIVELLVRHLGAPASDRAPPSGGPTSIACRRRGTGSSPGCTTRRRSRHSRARSGRTPFA